MNSPGPSARTAIDLINFQQWDFLLFHSFVVGLYAMNRLTMVLESEEVEERVVVSEMIAAFGRELREFSTVGIIRNVVNLVPFRNDRSAADK